MLYIYIYIYHNVFVTLAACRFQPCLSHLVAGALPSAFRALLEPSSTHPASVF